MSEFLEDRSDLSPTEATDFSSETGPVMSFGHRPVMIGRWTIEQYVDLTRWLVIGAAVIVAALQYVGIDQGPTFGVELGMFLLLGWFVVQRGGSRTESIAAGAIAGVGLGLLVSIVRLSLNREFAFVVNIISETMLTAIIGGLVTTIVTLLRKISLRST